jgi:hypothetical protein
MPGQVLTVGAVVVCAHGGLVQSAAPEPRVRVSGGPVLTTAAAFTVTGCPVPPPPVATGPCVSALWVSSAIQVRSRGVPLLLSDSLAMCIPSGAQVTVVATQTRVSAR